MMFCKIVFLIVLSNLASSSLGKMTEDELKAMSNKSKKQGKIFSLFSVVTFPNTECVTKSNTLMKGTCFTSSECANKGGVTDGNCAAGFGVCCMFTLSSCSSTITVNNTYIQNTGFPATATTSTTPCQYTVNPIQSDICQLRLDFNTFELGVNADGRCFQTGVAAADSFAVNTPTGAPVIPAICGINTGQHMYVETGSSTTPTTLTFNLGTGTGNKIWKIKVSQIECWNTAKAPSDCRQYFTGASGSFKSYGFGGVGIGGIMLAGMSYSNCFRQEQGFCSIDFTESTTATPDPFQLGTPTIGLAGSGACTAAIGVAIIIPNDEIGNNLYCGGNLVAISTHTVASSIRELLPPFTVGVMSIPNTLAVALGTGFNLVYNQVPCA